MLDKEGLAHIVAEISEVVPLVGSLVERFLTYRQYAPLAHRLHELVRKAVEAGCVELPGGDFGDGLTSLPIWGVEGGIVISPQEFTLWKGRMLKLQREAGQRLNAIQDVASPAREGASDPREGDAGGQAANLTEHIRARAQKRRAPPSSHCGVSPTCRADLLHQIHRRSCPLEPGTGT
jgi:hypothetical protein